MLRLLARKCYYCSRVHKTIEIKSFFSTDVARTIEIECGSGRKMTVSSGKLARLADGAAVARLGDTSVMTTVVSKGPPSTQNFLPLTVDYRQKAAAAGRIPTNFLRRELGASEREILVGRMIDRSVRPLFNKGYNIETGLTCNLLSVDGVHDPEVLSINAASAALSLSNIPWGPAVGAVRLGHVKGQVVVNPTRAQLSESSLNLVLAGTRQGLSTMIECDAKCLDHRTFINAISIGLDQCAKIAESIEAQARQYGRPKRDFSLATPDADASNIKELIDTLCSSKLRCIYTDYTLDKQLRDEKMFEVRADMMNKIRSLYPEAKVTLLGDLFTDHSRHIVRDLIFQENLRVDGRGITDIRNISCEVDLHKPLHGSALFQRGQTQVMCTVALDSLQSAMKLDAITALTGGVKEKNFMLHYEFPGFATGELGRGGSRRELGHGALAERAIRQVLPTGNQFTTRLTSEVLESNGSSSMASICGGTLALLDAGMKLSDMVSGVAMGLVTHNNGEHKVLTDIMGMEDFLGDMDFKFSSTRYGVCALQADVKLPGISLDVITEAIEGGIEANNKILDIMSSCINSPRESKACWPVSKQLEVPPNKRGKFLGQAGLNIRKITQDTGVQIHSEKEGVWSIFAPNPDAMHEAEAIIENLLTEEKVPELEFGAIYTGRVTEILERGVMIQLHDQIQPVLLHNSQLSPSKIHHASVLGLTVGQDLQVKYYGRDPVTGQMRLSRKALSISSAAAVKNLQASTSKR